MSIIQSESIILILLILTLTQSSKSMLDNHTELIFRQCSTQKIVDFNRTYADAMNRLYEKFVTKSSRFRFSTDFGMAAIGGGYPSSVLGMFQCRGDLDDHKCYECIKAIPNISNGLCDESMAARIQLSGCYIRYESDGYDDSTPEDELKHKACGEPQGAMSQGQFGKLRSHAFETLEEEMAHEYDHKYNNIGFYSIMNKGFHVMAQCEVGIRACECIHCVVEGINVIEQECVNSIFGQVFLSSCSLGFEFDPRGLLGGPDFDPDKKVGGGKGKIVAIGIGGALLLVMAFMFLRFCKKKNDDY